MTTPTCAGVYQDAQIFYDCGQGNFVTAEGYATMAAACAAGAAGTIPKNDADGQSACAAHWIGATSYTFTDQGGHDMPTNICCAAGSGPAPPAPPGPPAFPSPPGQCTTDKDCSGSYCNRGTCH